MRLTFGPFQLDEHSRALSRDGEPVATTDRDARVLFMLVSHAGQVISKDALVAAGWDDVAVSDNSLEQAISRLRRTLGPRPGGGPFVETVPRRGYRFAAPVQRVPARATEVSLDALLAPHRTWLEGRAALETLNREQVLAAEQAFERVITLSPDYAPAYIGLSNACALRFEATRADERPDQPALRAALRHAQEACRLDPSSGEAWATLGFVLHRAGDPVQAVAAARRAVSLEPDNWRHHLRLASVGWGEERLRAAGRTLQLMPGLALANWLAATVHIARQAFDAAEREIDAGALAQDRQLEGAFRFTAVGMHWLRGLVRLRERDETGARESFGRELAFEATGHLYARECCANTWYALGALSAHGGDRHAAIRAFDEALQRVRGHLPALVAKAALAGDTERRAIDAEVERRMALVGGTSARGQMAVAVAGRHALNGAHDAAAAVVRDTLANPAGAAAGWLIPVEPLLAVWAHPVPWAPVLAALRAGAA